MSQIGRILMILIAVNLLISFASANDSPYASISREGSSKIIDSVVVSVCEELILSGHNSKDYDGSIEYYHWYDGEKLLSQESTVSLTIKDTSTKEIKLVATDNGEKTDEAKILVYSHPTQDPTIGSISGPGDSDLYQTDSFSVAVKVPKNGDEFQKLEIAWDYDEEIIEKTKEDKRSRRAGEEYMVTFQGLKPGRTKIIFSATNLCGKIESEEVEIRISSSQSPKIRAMNIPLGVQEGKRFEISADVSNCEEGCSYRYEIVNLGYFDRPVVASSGNQVIRTKLHEEGSYGVNLTVTNKAGVSTKFYESFEVENTENDPPIADASATAKYAVIDEAIQLNGTKSHDDGKYLIFRWLLKDRKTGEYNEIFPNQQKNSVRNFNFTRTGRHEIRLIVEDDAFPSLKSKAYDFSIDVIASQEELEASSIVVKKTENIPQSYRPSRAPTRADNEIPIAEILAIPGFELLAAILALLLVARTSRRDL